jgi:hypothetical protein
MSVNRRSFVGGRCGWLPAADERLVFRQCSPLLSSQSFALPQSFGIFEVIAVCHQLLIRGF